MPLRKSQSSFAMFFAFVKVSFVDTAIFVVVVAISVWFSVFEFTTILISCVCVSLDSDTMLYTDYSVAFISIPISPHVFSSAVWLRIFSVPNIVISFRTPSYTTAFFDSAFPVPFVNFTICPSVDSEAICFAISK